MVKVPSMGAIYTDTSAYRRNNRIDSAVKQLNDEMNIVKQQMGLTSEHSHTNLSDTNLNGHIAVSDNNFSIDNVNTIAKFFGKALSRLNWMISLINEKKSTIIEQNSYSKVIRPIIELKYGSQKEEDDFNIYVFQFAKQNMLYFYQSNPGFDDKHIYNLNEPHKTIFKDLNEKFYDPTVKLISDNQAVLSNSNRLYNCLFGLTVNGIDLQIQYIMKDLLDNTKYVIISETLCITKKMAQINSYDTIPPAFNTYLKTVQDNFNNFAKAEYDSTLGTVYQFGENKNFNKLLVVSSQDYPSWNGMRIVDSYIPGSNVDMPAIIFNINVELNRNYTGMSEGEIVLVQYAVGPTYYTGIVKMLKRDDYDGLCYQIQSININKLFPTSVTMTGDVEIQGNLNILRYDGEKVISTDNTRKVVSFHDKVGINQHPYEVNGLLDIDNLTQQNVLDLFDKFVSYSVNSTDIMSVIGYLSIKSALHVNNLFQEANALFDYKNQCAVFSVPIKPIIYTTDVSILHNAVLDASIITSDFSFTRLQQIVKEVNQMLPEVENATGSYEHIFSFTELLKSQDIHSYMTSMRAIIVHDNSEKRLIFVMTCLDVTDTMNDDSTGKPFLKTINYVSREMRFMNYASLLFKDTSLIDNDGKYTTDTNGNIKLSKSIKNNPYFSNRFGLLPESYIFSLNLSNKDKYVIMEGALHWSDRYPIDVWSGENNVQVVVELINGQNDELYNKRLNSTFAVNYRWRGGRKISFTNTVRVGGNSILIGSGFDLNSLLDQSMIVNGDNTISGNFFVNDSNNNNIFKVDNVNKTITNTYKVGIGIEEPKSILDIKDTTINDVLDEIDAGSKQYNILNKIAEKLRENAPFDNTTNFANIIDDVYSDLNIEQTHDNYTSLTEININTMSAGDVKVSSHWLYSHWNGQYYKDIQDPVNQFAVNVAKTFFTHILNNELIYDNALIHTHYKWVFGWKKSRIRCLVINKKMYMIRIGTNIQDFGLRSDSNSNITTLINNTIRGCMTMNRIYSYMDNTITFNNNESLNVLRRLNMEYTDIQHSKFILTIDTTNINSTTLQEITLFDVRNIPSGELQRLFNYFDADGDGYLTNDELINFSNATGFGINDLITSPSDLENGAGHTSSSSGASHTPSGHGAGHTSSGSGASHTPSGHGAGHGASHTPSGSGLINNTVSNNDGKISLQEIMTKFVPIKYGDTQLITNSTDYNMVAKYKNFWVIYMQKQYNMSINEYNVIHYEDLFGDFITGIKCTGKTGNKITLLCDEMRVQDVIKPSLSVQGDTRIDGDLMITCSKHAHHNANANFVSINAASEFMGIGTDDRFINYSDMTYSTTDSIYAGRHNLNVLRSSYPVVVSDRIQENDVKIDSNIPIDNVPTDEMSYFSTYSAYTAKRTSRLYTFDEIVEYAEQYDKKAVQSNDKVTHLRYGPDISFEVRDANDRTVEIGQVQMVIDRSDNGVLRGGFGVQVNDPEGEDTTFENSRRNLMYVDNDSQLFVEKINLNGIVLENDGSDNLLCNGGHVYNSSAKFPYQQKFPTKEQLEINLNNKFIHDYHQYIEQMISFFKDKLSNNSYMTMLNDYTLSNKEYQTRLINMVNQYNISNNQAIRVQMVTVSGAIFADNNHPADTDVTSTPNVYNNPEIAQAILVGVGGMARCTADTKLLNVCIGIENKWGTVVLTRLIMNVPLN
jgi:hypothetical protein